MNAKRRLRRWAGRPTPESETSSVESEPAASAGTSQPVGLRAESWAIRAVVSALRLLEDDIAESHVEIKAIHMETPDSLSIIFEAPWLEGTFGLHLDGSVVLDEEDYTSGRPGVPIRQISAEGLGFDIAYLMIGEPFDDDALGPVDAHGVRWLAIATDV